MRSIAAALPFVFLTVLCWGNYGPLMHEGRKHMGGALLPFVGVGFAYFVIAVIVPWILLRRGGEQGHWSVGGTLFSIGAGSLGALGALGVIMAFTFGGSPVYVMPMVFGGAPIMNTIVTALMAKSHEKISPTFLFSILLAASGAAAVLYFKPVQGAAATAKVPEVNLVGVVASIITGFLCWGSYGPILHKGQMKMGGSRLRPFLCVGIAYFIIAVFLPLLILPLLGQGYGDWSDPEMRTGLWWSLAGGAAGAIGALGIVLAFNFGGKPIFVMPLVFGLAPVINTVTTLTEGRLWGEIGLTFLASLLVTIIGAVCVLIFAPKPIPPKPAAEKAVSVPQPAAP